MSSFISVFIFIDVSDIDLKLNHRDMNLWRQYPPILYEVFINNKIVIFGQLNQPEDDVANVFCINL